MDKFVLLDADEELVSSSPQNLIPLQNASDVVQRRQSLRDVAQISRPCLYGTASEPWSGRGPTLETSNPFASSSRNSSGGRREYRSIRVHAARPATDSTAEGDVQNQDVVMDEEEGKIMPQHQDIILFVIQLAHFIFSSIGGGFLYSRCLK